MSKKNHEHPVIARGVISLTRKYSFVIKGWTIAHVPVLFAIAAMYNYKTFVIVAFLRTVIFYFFESYHLYQYWLSRNIYDSISKETTDFFSLSVKHFNKGFDDWESNFLS